MGSTHISNLFKKKKTKNKTQNCIDVCDLSDCESISYCSERNCLLSVLTASVGN